MYTTIRHNSQMGNERRIIIDEVNPSQLFISGKDSYGKIYRVVFDFHGAVIAIPVTGEMWTVKQYNNEWRLDRRVDTGVEQIKPSELSAGDRRLEAPNELHLNGGRVLINGNPHGLRFDLSTLPDPTTLPPGTIVYVSDAPDGQQFKGTNGTAWKNLG